MSDFSKPTQHVKDMVYFHPENKGLLQLRGKVSMIEYLPNKSGTGMHARLTLLFSDVIPPLFKWLEEQAMGMRVDMITPLREDKEFVSGKIVKFATFLLDGLIAIRAGKNREQVHKIDNGGWGKFLPPDLIRRELASYKKTISIQQACDDFSKGSYNMKEAEVWIRPPSMDKANTKYPTLKAFAILML
jgi:hypothetical protein